MSHEVNVLSTFETRVCDWRLDIANVVQLVGKARVVAVKLAKAEKTGRDLQLLNMKKEDVATNQQHQQNYQKQMKVCMLCRLCSMTCVFQ